MHFSVVKYQASKLQNDILAASLCLLGEYWEDIAILVIFCHLHWKSGTALRPSFTPP
jgi:hypothetical protein